MKKILLICTFLTVLICAMTSCSHEHQWSEWQVSKAATCTQDGINIRVCDDCGESQSIPVSATGHTWSAWYTTKEATCTVDGSNERSCACGEKETQTISATGHTWSAWNTTKEATCTVDGSKERSCACGEKETQTKSATGHTWKDATCTEAKKCSKCGLTDGSALGHTCSIGTCGRCSTTVYPTINLPSVPATFWNHGYCSMKITELSYKFNSYGDLIISFSGEKTYGTYEFIGFQYKILDKDGYVITTGTWLDDGYNVGDKFRSKTIKISSNLDGSSEYTIVITDND